MQVVDDDGAGGWRQAGKPGVGSAGERKHVGLLDVMVDYQGGNICLIFGLLR